MNKPSERMMNPHGTLTDTGRWCIVCNRSHGRWYRCQHLPHDTTREIDKELLRVVPKTYKPEDIFDNFSK